MAADIPRRELESIDEVFDIYVNIGEKGIDANDLGDALRALNLNPTLAVIEKLGGTKKRNEKKITKEEFLPIYSTVRKDKESGCYEDFLECLKLYDKEENGTMLLAELNHILLSLGETLDQEQVDELFKDCMDPEDEEGFIPYAHINFMYEIMADPKEGLDAVDLADGLRVLNLNPTLEMIKKHGGTERRNEKKIPKDDFLPIYAAIKQEKEQGCYEDFLECLKLYDKNENGLMLLSELNYAIRNLGEPLDEYQGDELFEDCVAADEEDDDGYIPYHKFLARMCDRQDILNA